MNIKSERVHQLAREAARVTGKSQTGAIEEALEKLLASYAAAKVDAVNGLLQAYGAEAGEVEREIRTVEDLYNYTHTDVARA